ncbi:Fibroblast growth factor 23 [Xenotaenia resolanae]|uniref:Fibroblast growth factor 23 n=1 Tax=Xenotaenia resolanae TaxID=208358 RepID=A0ABV0WD33_9TELE
MDLEGNAFTSPVCLKEECLFNHKLLENNRDVYYSTRTGILFNLEGSRQVYSAGQNLPQTALFLPKKNTVPLERLLLHREKRNQVVDPSDPHNVLLWRAEEGSDSRAVREDDGDLDVEVETEVGDDGLNASRETQLQLQPQPPSNHDPWNAQSSRQASPWNTGTVG